MLLFPCPHQRVVDSCDLLVIHIMPRNNAIHFKHYINIPLVVTRASRAADPGGARRTRYYSRKALCSARHRLCDGIYSGAARVSRPKTADILGIYLFMLLSLLGIFLLWFNVVLLFVLLVMLA